MAELGGDITSGPDNEVVIDARGSILLDHVTVALARDEGGGEHPVMLLGGRVNQVDQRAQVLVQMTVDGAAQVVTAILDAIDGTELASDFDAALER